jgi:hypothetical protein
MTVAHGGILPLLERAQRDAYLQAIKTVNWFLKVKIITTQIPVPSLLMLQILKYVLLAFVDLIAARVLVGYALQKI